MQPRFEFGVGGTHVGLTVVAGERQFVSVGVATDIFGGELVGTEGVALLGPQPLELDGDEATVGVVEVFAVVVAVEDGELGAVDGAQLVGGDAQHEGHEGVDLDEGLTAVEVAAQQRTRPPLGPHVAEPHRAASRQRPRVGGEERVPASRPQISISPGDAIQTKRAQNQR